MRVRSLLPRPKGDKPLENDDVTICLRLSLDGYARLLLEAARRGVSSGEALDQLLHQGEEKRLH